MNRLDCLREEMASRGLTQAQIESKTAAVVLDILSESGDKYQKMWGTEKELTKRASAAQQTIRDIHDQQYALDRKENELREVFETERKYIDDFNKSLEECETQEGRDRMRIAQMFVNSVDIDTKYDNTAFIIGLAAILSDGEINAIKELKKINSKIPSPFEGVRKI